MKDTCRAGNRTVEGNVDGMFPDRWSPRSFLNKAVPEADLQALFEAARWAPSCYNEQPWEFHYAVDGDRRRRFLAALVEQNRRWADRAPVIIFLAAKRKFTAGDRENKWAAFDAGAAWMSLALQARKMGLYAHAMAGFNRQAAHEATGLDKDAYLILVAIAVGFKGDASVLPQDLAEIEFPNSRKKAQEISFGAQP